MTRFARHLAALSCTALVSVALLAGAVGPANGHGRPLASGTRIVA